MLALRRRRFMTLLGGAVATWPLDTHAQQPKVPTIGVLVRAAPGWQRFQLAKLPARRSTRS